MAITLPDILVLDINPMNIYPADGNPTIAAMIMAFALLGKDTKQNIRGSILRAQVYTNLI